MAESLAESLTESVAESLTQVESMDELLFSGSDFEDLEDRVEDLEGNQVEPRSDDTSGVGQQSGDDESPDPSIPTQGLCSRKRKTTNY